MGDSGYAIVLHGDYHHVFVGLSQQGSILEQKQMTNRESSKYLLSFIDELLINHALTLRSCEYLAATQGPSPITTLRVILATINGLQLALKIPLVGIDGLDAYIYKIAPTLTTRWAAILLNAFGDDLFYALYDTQHATTLKSTDSITNFITQLQTISETDSSCQKQLITCFGNGATLHQEIIKKNFGDCLVIAEPNPETTDLITVSNYAWKLYQDGFTNNQLAPLYQKSASNFIKAPVYPLQDS